MKKLTRFLLTLCLLAATLATLVVPAAAAEKDFEKDYFPTGKIEAPAAPYIKETQFEGHDSQLAIYYYQTADLQKLAIDIQENGAFYDQYGIAQLDVFTQIDVKFNDGPWVSERGNWDALNEDSAIDYGENIREWNLTFLHIGDKSADDADQLQTFTQSWLAYFEPEESFNDYLKPYVSVKKTEADDSAYYFDFNEVTITYRIRWCVKCLIDEYTENAKWIFLTSDWSPETSIGKNGNQKEPKMPEKIEAPVLSEFELAVNEDGSSDIRYIASLPDALYEAVRYELIVNDWHEPYYIDAEVKINDGDWFTVDVSNSTWMENGRKASRVSEDEHLKTTDDAWIRVRICSTQDESDYTEWSNIIGTKAIDGEPEAPAVSGTLEPSSVPTVDNPPADTTPETTKCKVCGFCPIQPLGICLFIWIAVILLFVLILVIVIAVASKKKKNKQNR